MKVKNGSCIRRLSRKSLWASRKRNLIAIMAIALTALLFTSLFTIALSINEGFQQSNFRQAGSFAHGGFKLLTKDQFEQLREDPLIRDWGLRRFLGMPMEETFLKDHVEISYCDENAAHWMFCDPIEGRLPKEGTDEAAADTRVLELLGVTPELGAKFTITFPVDGHETTQTFTLCGWWEEDPVAFAKHVLIPESRVDAVLAELGIDPENTEDGMTGRWNLDVMLGSSLNIEGDLLTILANHGYTEGRSGENQISIGVNWGYSGAQLLENMDAGTLLAGVAAMALIVFSGYLIIYNIFRISVTGDIRFYGLLKTLGTTPRQLKRIIRGQAVLLFLGGIPVGLLLGWVVGALLTPVIVGQLNGVEQATSVSPVIFVGAAGFALVTVLLSSGKPGRMAAKVSPVEAVRYTEASAGKKKHRTSKGKISLFSMAWANLGRSKSKTALTVTSLCLAVVLLNGTVTITSGFDLDKYLKKFFPVDVITADAAYFQVGRSDFEPVSEEWIAQVESQGGIASGGRTYGKNFVATEFVAEDYFRSYSGRLYPSELEDTMVEQAQRNDQGLLSMDVQLYGMEKPILEKITVLEGDIAKVMEPGSNYIAAVYTTDDYGKPYWGSNWAKLGDTVTIRYWEEVEFYNPDTGETYPEDTDWENVPWAATRATAYRDVSYTVAALVDVPHTLSYRYYGLNEFILNGKTFIRDSGTRDVMYYACNMEDEAAAEAMEVFLAKNTENTRLDYESKFTQIGEFDGVRNMFLMLGGTLSFIVGLIGVLNFFNTMLTAIFSRQREFAVLQAVGMTEKQLKTMLIWEGILYTLGAALAALILSIGISPLLRSGLESMFWFFTYRTTFWPVAAVTPIFAALGIGIPALTCRTAQRRSVVERLRME